MASHLKQTLKTKQMFPSQTRKEATHSREMLLRQSNLGLRESKNNSVQKEQHGYYYDSNSHYKFAKRNTKQQFFQAIDGKNPSFNE